MATDQEIVDQIDLVKSAMFRLEQMASDDVDDPRRRSLYPVRVEFGQVAMRLIGTRPAPVPR